MFCRNCGKNLRDGARFCPSCGQSAPRAPVPVPPPEADVSPKPKKRKTWLIVLLAIVAVILAAGILTALAWFDVVQIPFLDDVLGKKHGHTVSVSEKESPEEPEEDAEENLEAKPDYTIRIGLYEPHMTEDDAARRQQILGIRYANSVNSTVELAGESYTVEVVQSDDAAALAEAGVHVVLGDMGDDEASSIFRDAGIGFVGMSCSSGSLTVDGTYGFYLGADPRLSPDALADFLSNEFTGVNFLCIHKEGDEAQSESFCRYYDALCEYGFIPNDAVYSSTLDFTDLLLDVGDDYDAFIFLGSEEDALSFMKQETAFDLQVPILGTGCMETEEVRTLSLSLELPVIVVTDCELETSHSFANDYTAWLTDNPDLYDEAHVQELSLRDAALGMDAYDFVLQAIDTADAPDADAIRNCLAETVYDGLTGTLFFDAGVCVHGFVEIKNAQPSKDFWMMLHRVETNIESDEGSEDIPKDAPPASDEGDMDSIVLVVTSADFEPFTFIDDSGSLAGYDIDIITMILLDLFDSFDTVVCDFSVLPDMLQNGQADLAISAMESTPERLQYMDATIPYYADSNGTEYVIYLPKGSDLLDPINEIIANYREIGLLYDYASMWGLDAEALKP